MSKVLTKSMEKTGPPGMLDRIEVVQRVVEKLAALSIFSPRTPAHTRIATQTETWEIPQATSSSNRAF